MTSETQWRMRWNDGAPDSVTKTRTQAIAWVQTVRRDPTVAALLEAFERSDDGGVTWRNNSVEAR